jgi:hypothetical protein
MHNIYILLGGAWLGWGGGEQGKSVAFPGSRVQEVAKMVEK